MTSQLLKPATVSKRSLRDIVKRYKLEWRDNFTCITQDNDGLLVWWKCDIELVLAARSALPCSHSLIPILGVRNIGHLDPYKEAKKDSVAFDWMSAVVTKEDLADNSNQTKQT